MRRLPGEVVGLLAVGVAAFGIWWAYGYHTVYSGDTDVETVYTLPGGLGLYDPNTPLPAGVLPPCSSRFSYQVSSWYGAAGELRIRIRKKVKAPRIDSDEPCNGPGTYAPGELRLPLDRPAPAQVIVMGDQFGEHQHRVVDRERHLQPPRPWIRKEWTRLRADLDTGTWECWTQASPVDYSVERPGFCLIQRPVLVGEPASVFLAGRLPESPCGRPPRRRVRVAGAVLTATEGRDSRTLCLSAAGRTVLIVTNATGVDLPKLAASLRPATP